MGRRIPVMIPAPGDRLQRFVGDCVRFQIRNSTASGTEPGWRARLRTNLGRADTLRREILDAHTRGLPGAGAAWRDLEMRETPDGWFLDVPLAECGYFSAKAYLLDPRGWQHWPEGPDVGIAVHPNAYRSANTIYCAFPRLFGASRTASRYVHTNEPAIESLARNEYAVIPPSGKLRDLVACLPHIVDELGCRILHLLPVNPTPVTYARFGRLGSPYAVLDLSAVDPALVKFDRRTTGIDQFRELTFAAHIRGARVFLDIVINHTGWGSRLQENHPEWFLRDATGAFVSPGAWGVTWEDLVELKHENVALWDRLADVFLTWCRRGVDGFRCDAGYKVPVRAWQYIIARVQQEYPETVFLLEGLGGAWEATEALLTEGGMQWAYSELFQNYSGSDVAAYLDYVVRQSGRIGIYVHYSETHDNDRLAAKRESPESAAARPNREWSLLRNRLCALASASGAFGITCGVEWLATEKIRVHDITGLSWDSNDNIIPEIAALNRLLCEHPCFFDGATLTRLSPSDSPVLVLLRESNEGLDAVLVLVNNDLKQAHRISTVASQRRWDLSNFKFELLGQRAPAWKSAMQGMIEMTLPAGAAFCLAPTLQPAGVAGNEYRQLRARAAWGVQALAAQFPEAVFGGFSWRKLAEFVDRSPFHFLARIRSLNVNAARADLDAALETALQQEVFPAVVRWGAHDRNRITPVPPDHWLLIEDEAPFRASLEIHGESRKCNVESIATRAGHVAFLSPRTVAAEARLTLERQTQTPDRVEAAVRFLNAEPRSSRPDTLPAPDSLVLLTNGIGGMARMCIDLGRIRSKYDCVLGANLHPSLPVDRHVFVKRIRVWVNADGFLSCLDRRNLARFETGPPAMWQFVANAGDGRTVEIEMRADMVSGRNATVFSFYRPGADTAAGKQLPAHADVRLTVRVDIEDRNFHWETKRNGAADHHFQASTRELNDRPGFAFTPAPDRQLRVFADKGLYHPEPEWSENLPHPVEESRGQTPCGDTFSPGWFELPMSKGERVVLTVSAEPGALEQSDHLGPGANPEASASFEAQLTRACRAFVVRRGEGKTVIAGYPWFLDWGRDTFICARGLLAAGWVKEVKNILLTFARFEKNGTLPNTIFGDDASNRDTSDAPLWFGLVCEEMLRFDASFHKVAVEDRRSLADVLRSIAEHYVDGTPNGIRMDPDSALIWSPSHFTWMDTNHPAGTPREGYPVEIQALWIRFLRFLATIDQKDGERWKALAGKAVVQVDSLFWLDSRGYYSDVLLAPPGRSALEATPSDALRSNSLFPVSLGIITGPHARSTVTAVLRHLLVPGAVRSLAPLPVSVPLPIMGGDGRVLNDPHAPYRGQYIGDEDTSRKLAYHNGTAWTWTLPVFCEALARAWDMAPAAVAAARAYLGSLERSLNENCLGQLPEVVDGDAPHTQRGCDAQAWSATEALRVWKLLTNVR